MRIESGTHVALQRNKRREQWFVYGGVAAAIAVVALAATFVLLQLRDDANARLQTSSLNLATSLNQTIDGLYDSIDIALLASADEISQQLASKKPDSKAISRYLELQVKRLPHVAFLRATDPKGDVVFGPDIPVPYANLSDREFFKVLQSDPKRGLFVTKPLVGKISRKSLVSLIRRINLPDGSFAGTVYASIYVDEIDSMLRQIKMENKGSISLRDQDMGLIARHTFGAENTIPVGNQKISEPFQRALQRSMVEGSFTSDSTSLDPVFRHYAYRRSDKYGYVVIVGVPVETGMHQWRNQVGSVFALLAMFSLALIALVAQIGRSRANLEKMVVSLEGSRSALQKNHAQLARQEAEQRSLLEKLNLGIVVHAPDSRITFSNARASELLGLSEDQMLGKTAVDPDWCFVDTAGQRMALQDYPVARVLATLKSLDDMVLGVKTTGKEELTWLQGSAFPEFDAEGNLKQVVVNFHDITHMRESDERWRFALEGSGDGVWDFNLSTDEILLSGNYQEILGYAQDELPRSMDALRQLVHPDDAARTHALRTHYLQDPRGTYAAEIRLRCKDGGYKWLYTRGMVVSTSADGKPLRMVGTHTDISDLKAAEAKVWNEANFDSLTQLPNRRLFYDRLEVQIKHAKRDEGVLALLFIDLDHFKEVNDTLGHHVGDKLLVEAAQRIKDAVRAGDTVARLGGDEFTVTLAGHQSTSDIAAVGQKIIDLLSHPFNLGGSEAYVSASVGIALYPNDALTVNDLVKNADQAMYAAKAAGRKGFRFFTETMQKTAIARMALAADLRRALTAGQFQVHYQPIVDLASGAIWKAEALLRWNHPERGLVSPAEFIPLAEDIGAIHDIGDWIFLQAAHQVATGQARYHNDFQISVNKSPVQFSGERHSHGDWVDELRKLGVAGKSIVIEITEGVLMASNARVAASLMQFRDAGIQVAIDDFGTGYSSLAYLKKFDIDYLKIDQSFVRNLALDSADFALCEAIIVMAHKLGLKVIAEGVETAQQRDLLASIGCDFAQGYFFSRPVPAEAFENLLA